MRKSVILFDSSLSVRNTPRQSENGNFILVGLKMRTHGVDDIHHFKLSQQSTWHNILLVGNRTVLEENEILFSRN